MPSVTGIVKLVLKRGVVTTLLVAAAAGTVLAKELPHHRPPSHRSPRHPPRGGLLCS
jgi:hypothetical protein